MKFDIVYQWKCGECGQEKGGMIATEFSGDDEKDAAERFKQVFGHEKLFCHNQTFERYVDTQKWKPIETMHEVVITAIVETPLAR